MPVPARQQARGAGAKSGGGSEGDPGRVRAGYRPRPGAELRAQQRAVRPELGVFVTSRLDRRRHAWPGAAGRNQRRGRGDQPRCGPSCLRPLSAGVEATGGPVPPATGQRWRTGRGGTPGHGLRRQRRLRQEHARDELAAALAEGGKRQVILVDLDLAFGDVGIMMRLVPKRGIATWRSRRH